jgi:hypothetical protein
MTLSISLYIRECRYDLCRNLCIVMLNVVMLSVVMLNVVMLSVATQAEAHADEQNKKERKKKIHFCSSQFTFRENKLECFELASILSLF